MNGSTTVQVRVDEQTKAQAKKVLDALHLTMSEAICLFLRQVVLQEGLPFEVRVPNKRMRKAIADLRAGKGKVYTGNTKDIFDTLEKGR